MALLRVIAPLASLCLFSALSIAQVSAPNCTLAAWQWTFNSLTQSPCNVTANLMATCDGGNYSLGSLPPGDVYYGANGNSGANLCYCNTVAYSLFSACGACQGRGWAVWSEWVTNCTKLLPPQSFPNPVPSGVYVPQWALLDVTNENDWNANKSYSVGDSPELGPGSILGPSSVSVTPTSSSASPTSSYTRSPTPSPPKSNSSKSKAKQNTAAIAGGVVGGVVAITFAAVAIFFRLRRSSQVPPAVSAAVEVSQPQPPPSDEGALLSLAEPPIPKFYDPDDPTTFPGYQGGPHLQDIPSQGPMSSNIGTRNTLGDTQTSLPQARGYHGLPIV